MNDAINKLVKKDNSVSLKKLTKKVSLMGLRYQKSLLESNLISEGFKLLASVEA